MSQAFRQVDWCLKKAEREIEECKRFNKKAKHRGLIEIIPNIQQSKMHIEKAEHYLEATDFLKEKNFSDICASTLFYSMYHCLLAIASKFGYESGNQTCTISLIEYLREKGEISIDSKFIDLFKYESETQQMDSAIEMREDYTYGIKTKVDEKKIEENVLLCKELIDKTKIIVYK
jgi:uncharacterized protein (UPF0332 family)